MKKSFLKGSVALLIFFLVGCTNDPSAAIVGTWQLEEDAGKIVAFSDDGLLSTKNGEQTGSGSWSMSANGKLDLEIANAGGSVTFTCKLEFVDNQMVLTSAEGEVEKYVRVNQLRAVIYEPVLRSTISGYSEYKVENNNQQTAPQFSKAESTMCQLEGIQASSTSVAFDPTKVTDTTCDAFRALTIQVNCHKLASATMAR